MTTSADRVSAVVCSKNRAASIERCLEVLRANGVGEIIVVDASSTDGTTEIAQQLADQVLTDSGAGLGVARNIGIARTTLDFVLNCGADNVMPKGSVDAMVDAKLRGGWAGVAAVTLVDGHGYLAWATRLYKLARFAPGERRVIGTPTLFDGSMLREHPFDEGAKYSDDAELCERWARQFGARFAIADVVVHEVGQDDLRAVFARWRTYGISDCETYRRSRAHWSYRRRLWSLLHPLRVDFLEPVLRIPLPRKVGCLPFLTMITSARYFSWIRAALPT